MGKSEVAARAVFLDRDGVLNQSIIREGKPYPPSGLAEFKLSAGVQDGCARLKAANFLLVVVTNQPDVGRGSQTRETVEQIHQQLRRLVPEIDQIEVCYHGGEGHGQPCACRKPKPGMILESATALGIDLETSFMIGDRWRDVDCAQAAGCRAIFIDHGYSEKLSRVPDFVVTAFSEAVDVVLRESSAPVCSALAQP